MMSQAAFPEREKVSDFHNKVRYIDDRSAPFRGGSKEMVLSEWFLERGATSIKQSLVYYL